MITFRSSKIILQDHEPSMNPTSEELAKVIMNRIGLEPRKKGSTDKMFRTMIELYERSKVAHREKRPEAAIMTVEEMGVFAGITRQTMYDYLRRWLDLNMIVKTSYIKDNKVIIGYKLNGSTLEQSFEKAIQRINQNMNLTKSYISQLQKQIKNEKISESQKKKSPLTGFTENDRDIYDKEVLKKEDSDDEPIRPEPPKVPKPEPDVPNPVPDDEIPPEPEPDKQSSEGDDKELSSEKPNITIKTVKREP